MYNIFIFILLFCIGWSNRVTGQSRYYVNHAATGIQSGRSWQTAFTSLHDALALALSGDTIWVAQGTYKPTETGDRSAHFRMPSGVVLYGGFSALETEAGQRDPAAYPVILSGDIGMPGDSSDNSYNILYAFQADNNTVIDGFILEWANANEPGKTALERGASGGALFLEGAGGRNEAVVRRCLFRNNTARLLGGGVFINGDQGGSVAPLLEDCVFRKNRATGGGAVCRNGGSTRDRPADFLRCRFEYNHATYCGGLLLRDSEGSTDTTDVRDCIFERNSASVIASSLYFENARIQNASAVHLYGSTFKGHRGNVSRIITLGNLFGEAGNLLFRMDDCVVRDNSPVSLLNNVGGYQRSVLYKTIFTDNATQVNIEFGDIEPSPGDSSWLVVDSCVFVRNTRFDLSNSFQTSLMRKSTFVQNTLLRIAFEGKRWNNNLFWGNTISDCILRVAEGETLPFLLTNCTFANNHYPYTQLQSGVHPVQVQNSIIDGDTYIVLKGNYNKICYDHCLIIDTLNVAVRHCGPSSVNLLNTDPVLADTAAGDYRLHPCSPAVDAGNNLYVQEAGICTDKEGALRIQNGRVDIGAYESSDRLITDAPRIRAACTGMANGAFHWKATQGCPPYRLVWTTGTRSDTTRSRLPAGTYRVSLTDAKGRQAVSSITIPTSDPKIYFSGDSVVCPRASDAQITAGVAGTDALPVTWRWSNGASGPRRDSLTTGIYEVTATDTLGCRDTALLLVTQALPPELDSIVVAAVLPDAQNGSVSAEASGPYAPYSYVWNTGSTDARITQISPGLYTVTIQDAEGCTYDFSWRVDAVVSTHSPEHEQGGAYIFPNPAITTITIFFEATDQWQLFDVAGRVVRDSQKMSGAYATQVYLSDLPAGIYGYRFMQAGKVGKSGKLCILKK